MEVLKYVLVWGSVFCVCVRACVHVRGVGVRYVWPMACQGESLLGESGNASKLHDTMHTVGYGTD